MSGEHSAIPAAMILSLLAAAASAQLPAVQTGSIEVSLELVTGGLSGVEPNSGVLQVAPTKLVPDGQGRLFVPTFGGVVRIIEQGGLLATAYLDTTNPNSFNHPGRHGMTPLAFHPDFHDFGKPGYGRFYTIELGPRFVFSGHAVRPGARGMNGR